MFQRALICTDFTDGMYRLAQFVPALAAGGLKSFMFFHNVPMETEREIPRVDPAPVRRTQANADKLTAGSARRRRGYR